MPGIECSGWADGQMDRYSTPNPPSSTGRKGSQKAHALSRAKWRNCCVAAILAMESWERGDGMNHWLFCFQAPKRPYSSPGPVLPGRVCTAGSHPAPWGCWAAALPCSSSLQTGRHALRFSRTRRPTGAHYNSSDFINN